MSNSVHSLQAAHTQTQTQEAVQPPKTLTQQSTARTTNSQDTVTISQEARQALASNTEQASGGDTNPGGDNH
jgi:hypothetical protein